MGENKSKIVPLNGSNYATWKVQCRMALIKENVWDLLMILMLFLRSQKLRNMPSIAAEEIVLWQQLCCQLNLSYCI